jgi:predicted DCC family thiol-disulfide oxidoreductase YuxK
MIQNPLILFDGICNLCNRTVDFILKKDRKHLFRFVPLQTEAGNKLLQKYQLPENTDSVILIMDKRVYTESEAAIEIANLLPYPWRMAAASKVLPSTWRNHFYRWIVRNRYNWFGKKDACRIPTDEERGLFPDKDELGIIIDTETK